MGFQNDHHLPDHHTQTLFMLGNANPPPMMEYAINAIRRHA